MGRKLRLSFPGGIGIKIILPTVLIIALFTIPALIAWRGIASVESWNQSQHADAQALVSLHHVSTNVQAESRAQQGILAGDPEAADRFRLASDASQQDLDRIASSARLQPEAGWAADLNSLYARDRSLFTSGLTPAAAAGQTAQAREADVQLQDVHRRMTSLVSSLIQTFEIRSNDVALKASASATDNMRLFLAVMAMAGVIGLGLVAILIRRIAAPARELLTAARELSRGNLDARVKNADRGELAELGDAFNNMASSLQIRDEALQSEQAKLRSVHQSITDGIIVIGASGYLISANPAAEAIMDRTEASLAGSHQTGISELDAVLDGAELVQAGQMVKCWEYQDCRHSDCPSFGSQDLRCWLQCSTHCHDQIQGTFSNKRDACERCSVYRKNSCVLLDTEINGRIYAISVAPILNDEGQPEGRLAVLHDMTEERYRANQLSLLYEIANAIASTTDIDQSLQESLNLCIKAMKATSGSIMLIGEDDELMLTAQQGLAPEAVSGFSQSMGEGIAGWVAQSGEPLLLTEDECDERFDCVKGIRDAVCLPIRDQQRVVGVLSLNERKTPEGFTRDNLDFLSPVAVQIGMALSRARLHQKVAEEKEKQAAIVECMGESLCVRSRDRTILFANKVHKEIFGEDCVGRKCYEVYVGRDSICRGCPLDRCFTGNETVRRSHFVLDSLGTRRQLEATASPVRDASGVTSCIEISRDVTEMLRIRDQAKSRLDSLTTLFEVSNTLSASLEVSSIVDNLADSVLSALKASAATILIFEEASRHLVLRSVSGDVGGWAMKPGDTVDISHYGLNGLISGVGPFCATHTGQMTPASLSLAPPGAESVLAGRLSSRGKLLGLITVSSKRKGAFSEAGQMELFIDIANQAAVAIENANMYKRLEETFWSTIRSLAEAIDAKDSYTRGHSDRVAEYAEALARRLELKDEMLNAVRCAGYLHDTGKIGIPDAILLKPGRLTDDEYRQIMNHPVLSHKIIEPVDFPYDVKPLVRHHHERIDGSGYPDGLIGEQIPLGARIIGIADAYEAMTSDRPYRKALSQSAALAELERCAGTQFDTELVSAFIEVLND